MRTANRTKPKTDFGIEVSIFCAQTGMTKRELAAGAGVKYSTLVRPPRAAAPDTRLIPIARDFMQNYLKRAEG